MPKKEEIPVYCSDCQVEGTKYCDLDIDEETMKCKNFVKLNKEIMFGGQWFSIPVFYLFFVIKWLELVKKNK